MNKSVSFYTLGCRLNQAETVSIQKYFELDGYQVVDFGIPSDYVVINTCTVTENGDSDTRRIVNRVHRINSKAKIALVGCQAQIQKEKLFKLKNVYWVVGNEKKMELSTVITQKNTHKPIVDVRQINNKPFSLPITAIDSKHTRVNIKIQDGCNFYCSYCEIPYARGRAKSRVFNNIIDQARYLANLGYKEMVLTGINVGCYRYENKTIWDVVHELEKINQIKRIRISSIEPTTIPENLITKMNHNSKLCRYLHMPMQHANNAILKAMNRRYTIKEFNRFIQSVNVSDICLGTDIIVGFPGETEEYFQETFKTLQKLPFAYFHVFSYSDRNRNKSRMFSQKVPKHVIKHRSKKLRQLSNQKRQAWFANFLQKDVHVLFEQVKNGYWSGLTDNYIRVRVKSELNLQNKLLPVKLVAIDQSHMIGILQ
jgi:threonylcarbamoyladenosine tRNA methylthiotransferase MtaB